MIAIFSQITPKYLGTFMSVGLDAVTFVPSTGSMVLATDDEFLQDGLCFDQSRF
jgi:hypothetical protein